MSSALLSVESRTYSSPSRFGKVPWSAVHKHEMYTWLYWSIYNASYTSFEALPPVHQKALQEVCQLIERRSGTTIPEGSNPTVKPLLLTLDPVSVVWRPLVWYLAVEISNFFVRRRLVREWNVKFGTYHGLE